MRHLKLLLEAAIMAGGLILVLITLSGTTRDIGVIVSVLSVVFFMVSGLLGEQYDE
jgi:ABC-type polysaccharide/polyol phosphate export permease